MTNTLDKSSMQKPELPKELNHLADVDTLLELLVRVCDTGDYVRYTYSFWASNGEYEDDSCEKAEEFELIKKYVSELDKYNAECRRIELEKIDPNEEPPF